MSLCTERSYKIKAFDRLFNWNKMLNSFQRKHVLFSSTTLEKMLIKFKKTETKTSNVGGI